MIIFTNTYPYGNDETFLATEFPYLLVLQQPVTIAPLYGSGEMRAVSSTPQAPVTVSRPLLSFDPKDRGRLLFYGLFNCAPLFFAVRDFFAERIWESRVKMWQFGTSFLLIRAILSKNRRFLSSCREHQLLYFYWGDKSALILPFIKKGGKAVVRFHGSDLYEEAKGFLPFRPRLFPAIDLACPISRHGADYLLQRYGALTPPISVSYLGSIDGGLGPVPEDRSVFHIVSCAHIIPLKRLHLIAEAVKWVRSRSEHLEIRWTHIGDGPLRHQLEGCVDFCASMPHEAVMAFYRQTAVDLFLSTSRSEGVPVSMMEAMSFGIPVVATAVGGVPELVSDNVGCLLPQNPSVEEVAQRLLEFIALPEDARAAKRRRARAAWEVGWSGEVNYRAFVANSFVSAFLFVSLIPLFSAVV